MKRYVMALLSMLTFMNVTAQVEDTLDYAPIQQERNYEQEYDAMRKAARRAEIGRGLRFEFSPNVGVSTNSHIGSRGAAYSHHSFNAGAALLMHWPISRLFDISVGLGFRLERLSLHNSVQFDTLSGRLVGYDLTGWRDYRCWISDRSIYLPLRINIVTNRDHSVHLGLNLAYRLGNTFSYERMTEQDVWEPVNELAMNNIETLGQWKVELSLGMTYPLWWVFRWGWELYYSLTPTFSTAIPDAPSMHEFGLRVAL